MKKTILRTSVLIGLSSVLFSGCTVLSKATLVTTKTKGWKALCTTRLKKPENVCNVKRDLIVIKAGSNLSSYSLTHLDFTNSTVAALQAAAEATLKQNKNYFAIIEPSTISNLNGVLSNTAKEYIEKCETTLKKVLIHDLDPCGLHPHNNRRWGIMTITTYKEQPADIMTYNANDVLAYLKSKELYDDEGKITKIEKLFKN